MIPEAEPVKATIEHFESLQTLEVTYCLDVSWLSLPEVDALMDRIANEIRRMAPEALVIQETFGDELQADGEGGEA